MAKIVEKLRQTVGDLTGSLRSEDPPTRRAGRLFFATLILTLGFGIVGFRILLVPPADPAPSQGADNTVGFFDKMAQETHRKNTTLGLGKFVFNLKLKGDEPVLAGVMQMAQMELYIECDTKETCEYVEAGSVHARAEITKALIAVDREELLTRDKRRLKRAILERLNGWLPRGKIQTVHISKLVVS